MKSFVALNYLASGGLGTTLYKTGSSQGALDSFVIDRVPLSFKLLLNAKEVQGLWHIAEKGCGGTIAVLVCAAFGTTIV